MEEVKNYDLAILGGGPAALTAAIYAARYNINFIVITEGFGGTITGALEVENWPGQIASGTEIMDKVKKQADMFGTEYIQSTVESIEKEGKDYKITAGKNTIIAKSVIYTLGTKHRLLNIPGEKELAGKGVSYCATCDGMFFKGKKVTVIGGANSAAEGALYLADICKQVCIIYRKEKLRCEPGTLKQIEAKDNIEIIYKAVPVRIEGKNAIEKLIINQDGEEKELTPSGVFVEIGADAVLEPVKSLDLEMDNGFIKTDKNTGTKLPGFFAAGDVTDNLFKQMVVATGEGATAVAAAFDYVRFKY